MVLEWRTEFSKIENTDFGDIHFSCCLIYKHVKTRRKEPLTTSRVHLFVAIATLSPLFEFSNKGDCFSPFVLAVNIFNADVRSITKITLSEADTIKCHRTEMVPPLVGARFFLYSRFSPYFRTLQ